MYLPRSRFNNTSISHKRVMYRKFFIQYFDKNLFEVKLDFFEKL